jgi:hypothetical protein
MPLAANALTSVANARLWLRDSQADQARLELMINSVSLLIAAYTRREFVPAVNAATRRFRYDGGGILSLAPYDLRSVTAIVLFSDLPSSSQRTLAAQSPTQAGEYRLEPRNRTPEQTWLRVALPVLPAPAGAARAFGYEVAVTGDWAVGSVPADVEEAALIAIEDMWRNPGGAASRSLGAFEVVGEVPVPADAGDALPRAARQKLRRLMRARL